MAEIKYASLLNAYISTEGSNGIMTNYTYYSILVTYTDGSREIVEGRAFQLKNLLPYLRTPQDELMEIKQAIRDLRSDMNDIADQKMQYVIDTLFPIPDVENLNELDAIAKLEESGLTPVLVNSYPPNTPRSGVVRAFRRNSDSFKRVDLDVIHALPEVMGLQEAEALGMLRAAGFSVNVEHTMRTDCANGEVLSCVRDSDASLDVTLEICTSIPDTTGMPLEEALATLKAAGFEATVRKNVVYRQETPTVIRWISSGDNTVQLHVHVPAKTRCRHVDVRWTNLPDSNGDKYSATAEVDNATRSIIITVNASAGGRSKYKISEISSKSVLQYSQPQLRTPDVVLTPSASCEFEIELPAQYGFRDPNNTEIKLPESLSLSLELQYGLMKKVSIPLEFSFEW